MFSRFQKPQPLDFDTFPSAARMASDKNISFLEASERMRQTGVISGDDPRAHLDPMRIRQMSHKRMSELMSDYDKIAQQQKTHGSDAATRARYAAVVKAGREKLGVLDTDSHRRPDVAARAEFMALNIAKADRTNPAARELMMISAAASESASREKALKGFETGNIAKAAKIQNRSWLEVRDDLVRHGALSEKDPRRKIRKADIDNQKKGTIKRSNTLEPEALEDVAMRRLKKNPKDELATAWLATSGSICEDRAPKKVKGAEVQGVLPAKAKLFGSKTAAKKRAIDLDIL